MSDKIRANIFLLSALLTVFILAQGITVYAYWVWTPKTGKWVNPKYAVKGTPDEQMEWALKFYKSEEYKRAVSEFEKLIENYPNSIQAPIAQYYIGLSYEAMEEFYKAFLAYQKSIDKYPYNERFTETIERQYNIGNIFLDGQKAKIMGMKILPALDKAVEILSKVVENEPFGKYADLAQFKVGEAHLKQEFYEDAMIAFQKLIDDYPSSELVEDAKYNIALCTYYVSRDPYYDQNFTDKAIDEYKELIKKTSDTAVHKEANETLTKLREKKAKSAFETAKFYERTKHYRSAIIYYQEIIDNYGDTAVAEEAKAKISDLEGKLANDG
ncbi:MAG: outer membrane protein assembly factor BamD [Candidatus Omnitrophica bacterium]|nr:outer membrane protein assembly factor BamD [Candidatus Omnitrophota bacterium]